DAAAGPGDQRRAPCHVSHGRMPSRGAEELVVEDLGCHVGAVGPDDRAQLGVDGDASEVGDVAERLEHRAGRPPDAAAEVDDTGGLTVEGEPVAVVAEVLDSTDVVRGAHGSGPMLARGSCRSARAQFTSSSRWIGRGAWWAWCMAITIPWEVAMRGTRP